ncbi:MAG: RagB/SusD family nutrient uptake outer membrane protein [Mangrovibacterium sp.]
MKKLIYLIIASLGLTSCQSYLNTDSSSTPYSDFIFSDLETAKSALLAAYESFRFDATLHNSVNVFYDLSVVGSDIEHHPESFSAQLRHEAEYFYPNGTSNFVISSYNSKNIWAAHYTTIHICNALINAIEEQDEYIATVEAGEQSGLSDLHGQAVALRASSYWELIRSFGDVPYIRSNEDGHVHEGLTPRDYIYEDILNDLVEVEPFLYRVGEAGRTASLMSRTYVQGLIGRIALYAGGYATRRSDLGTDFYKDIDGNVISFETPDEDAETKSFYARRSDWKRFYTIAETYLQNCINNSGSATLITTDPRSVGINGEMFGNPFQYVFQMMMQGDGVISAESIYEITETQGMINERPYAFGRPSGGAATNAYPCKGYGQARLQASYYYGAFHPADMRRDVTACVTSSDGTGIEIINTWVPGSRQHGGIALNKWDENRCADPWTQTQRNTGINNPYMRMADVFLMYAEVKATLGKEAIAEVALRAVHNRAFSSTAKADEAYEYLKANSKTGSTMLDYVLEERKLEFGGEGTRRWDLIRTGKLGAALKANRTEMIAVVNDLEAQGYHEFPNGNILSTQIYTKTVDAKSTYGYRLTTQCSDTSDPVLFPGWRGQCNDWGTQAKQVGASNYLNPSKTNVAIQGLFSIVDAAKAEELLADGYVASPWGSDILKYRSDYADGLFSGYSDSDADAHKPPIYMIPLAEQDLKNSGITNGYGFAQK